MEGHRMRRKAAFAMRMAADIAQERRGGRRERACLWQQGYGVIDKWQ